MLGIATAMIEDLERERAADAGERPSTITSDDFDRLLLQGRRGSRELAKQIERTRPTAATLQLRLR